MFTLSCAIGSSSWGGQGMTEEELQALVSKALPSLRALVRASEQAPALIGSKDVILPLARLAAWVPCEAWIRPLEEWEGSDADSPEAALRTLIAHLLEKYEVVPNLRLAMMHTDGSPCSETAHRIALAFASVQVASGSGSSSVLDALKASVSPCTTKATAKHFTQAEDVKNPLHAFRRAQVAAFAPESTAVLQEAVCTARLGSSIGTEAEETFRQMAIQWVCAHVQTLQEPSTIAHTLDYFGEMHRTDSDFAVSGRTPKTVSAAMEAYEASTIEFTDDEHFQPNPRDIRPMFETDALIPAGTRLRVPYDPTKYELGGSGQRGSGKATIRVAEILSLRRLVYEGQQLGNCLENKYRSQVKYISRARQRVSSFWSLTKQSEDDASPQHLCLIEVWHLRGGNIIRQAEGPRPRTIPGPEAWYWLEVWCEREGVDLSTWDCYS